MSMKLFSLVLLAFGVVAAQAPGLVMAQAEPDTQAAIQAAQHRAGAAYRQLRQTQHEAKLAEQEYLNIQATHRAAPDSETAQREVGTAKRALDAAQARVAAARQAYDREVNTVDQLHRQSSITK
jgi:hypothetical protein